jgi:hypothetical protein
MFFYKNFVFTSLPCTLHCPSISSPLISSLQYLVRNKNYVALHYAVFSIIPLLHPSYAQLSSSSAWSHTVYAMKQSQAQLHHAKDQRKNVIINECRTKGWKDYVRVQEEIYKIILSSTIIHFKCKLDLIACTEVTTLKICTHFLKIKFIIQTDTAGYIYVLYIIKLQFRQRNLLFSTAFILFSTAPLNHPSFSQFHN